MTARWSLETPHPAESHFLHHHDDDTIHHASWIGRSVFCSDRYCRSQFLLTMPAADLPVVPTVIENKTINFIDAAALETQAA